MSINCKLQDLPPVGETSHKTGKCYCHLCTCGTHKCPGNLNYSDHYSKSALASMYKKDFTKKGNTKSQIFLRGSNLNAGSSKMDLKTTKQQDFVAHNVEKTKSAKYNRKTNYDVLKFAGVSNYQSEYPSWGHYEFINIGEFRTPYKASEVKISSQTTYGQFFSKNNGSVSEVNLKKPKDSNPLTVAGMFFGQTTSRDTYRGYGKNNFPEKAKNVAFGIVSLSSPPQLYNTLYKSSYDLKPLSPVYPKKPR